MPSEIFVRIMKKKNLISKITRELKVLEVTLSHYSSGYSIPFYERIFKRIFVSDGNNMTRIAIS